MAGGSISTAKLKESVECGVGAGVRECDGASDRSA